MAPAQAELPSQTEFCLSKTWGWDHGDWTHRSQVSPDVAGLGGCGSAPVSPSPPQAASQGFAVRSLPGGGPLEGFVRGLPQHFSLQVVEHSHPQQDPVPGRQRGTQASTQLPQCQPGAWPSHPHQGICRGRSKSPPGNPLDTMFAPMAESCSQSRTGTGHELSRHNAQPRGLLGPCGRRFAAQDRAPVS